MKLNISEGNPLPANEIVTGRTCVIGQSGSGKSYATGVICEELASESLGFCIIDTEGEYFSLKEKYTVLWAGSKKECDINIKEVNLKGLAKEVVKKEIPLILDVSEVKEEKDIVKNFLKEIYEVGGQIENPYLIIIEEIDKYAPQRGKSIPEIEEISRRGRKRGIGLLITTQRPALVDKNILSQCGNQIIGKLTIKNDLDSVKVFFSSKKNLNRLPNLKPGQFFTLGNITSQPKVMKFRRRKTKHEAKVPDLSEKKKLLSEDLEEVKSNLKGSNRKEEVDEEVDKEYLTLEPKISKEKAHQKIKSKTKKFWLFGEGKKVENLHLVLRPIYKCKVKYLTKKIMSKEYRTTYLYFDGITGNSISVRNGYKIISENKELIGLKGKDLEIFKKVKEKGEAPVSEISNEVNLSKSSTRNSLKKMVKRNLIKSEKEGRKLIYSPFTKAELPKVKEISGGSIEVKSKSLDGKVEETEIEGSDIEKFVEGLGKECKLAEKEKFFYPFYKGSIEKKNSEKEVFVDGISGRLVSNTKLI